jgi:hypothetical protein
MLRARSEIAHLRKRRLFRGRRLDDQRAFLAFTAEKQERKQKQRIRKAGVQEEI